MESGNKITPKNSVFGVRNRNGNIDIRKEILIRQISGFLRDRSEAYVSELHRLLSENS